MGGHDDYEKFDLEDGAHIGDTRTYYQFGHIHEYTNNISCQREVYINHVFKEGSQICVLLQDGRENWDSYAKSVDDFHLIGVATGTLDMETYTFHVHPMNVVDMDKMTCHLECMWIDAPPVKTLFAGYTIHVDLQVPRNDELIERCLVSDKIKETENMKDIVMQVLEQYGQFKSPTECLLRVEELSGLIQRDLNSSHNKRRFREMDVMMQKAKTIIGAQKYNGAKIQM